MKRGSWSLIGLVLVVALALPAWAQEKKVVRIWHTETEPQSVKAFQEIINAQRTPDEQIADDMVAVGSGFLQGVGGIAQFGSLFQVPEHRAHLADGLRKAGLPE